MGRRKGLATRRGRGGLALVVGLLLLLTGCGGGPKRSHLSGSVTYDGGKPVPAGEIYFDPDVRKNDGPQGFAHIKDGRYDTRQGGQAPGPGAYVVRILGGDGKPPPGADLPLGRKLFPEYSTPADIPDQDATRDFEVPVKR